MKKLKSRIKNRPNSFADVETAYNNIGLDFNWESVRYLLDVEGIAFSQIKSATFFKKDKPVIDILTATLYGVMAGLVGSMPLYEQKHEFLYKRATEILTDWQESYGSIELLWLFIIKQLEERHFFIDSLDTKILQELLKTSTRIKPQINQVLGQAQMMTTLTAMVIGHNLN